METEKNGTLDSIALESTGLTFKDVAGREWDLKLNLGIAKRLKDDKVIDLTRVLEKEMRRFKELMSDPFDLAGVVWEIVKPQVAAKELDFEQWITSLNGDALDAMIDAFSRAVADFSPALRPLILKGMEKGKTVKAATLKEVTGVMESADPQKIANLAGAQTQKALDNLMATLGGDSPGSSAATSTSPSATTTPSP